MTIQSLVARRYCSVTLWILAALLVPQMLADQPHWITPTADELAMKSEAQAPGVPALYLYREIVTDDDSRTIQFYFRLKVLTEGGRNYANVELPYEADDSGFSIANVAGRTIHSDGTIVPFEGKPYEKLLVKNGNYKFKAKIFTLPAAEVGSILEYRYTMRSNMGMEPPEWHPQDELFLRRGHYEWRPLSSGVQGADQIALTSHLPSGVEVKINRNNSFFHRELRFELNLENVQPIAREWSMPPAASVGYRVNFFYSAYKTQAEFWMETGKVWSAAADGIVLAGPVVKSFVQQTLEPTDTPERKLKKLYDAVMKLTNSNYLPTESARELKANGTKFASSSDEVLDQKRGYGGQLTALFVAMARTAGFKAFLAFITDRQERLFNPAYLSYAQLQGAIAIVSLDGKDVFFDPGQRYTEFKHLSWRHAVCGGIRQTETGTQLFTTPGEIAKVAHVERIADLTMDEHGAMTGTVKVTSSGDPAHGWRELALLEDETALRADLRSEMEGTLPHGVEVKVAKVANLADPDKPLVVSFEIEGGMGVATGKRVLVPANLFHAKNAAHFTEAERETTVMMPYASYYQDAIRLRFPKTMELESAPTTEQMKLKLLLFYNRLERPTADGVISYRDLIVAQNAIPVEEYAGLKDFYTKLETKDREPLVLIHASTAAVPGGVRGAQEVTVRDDAQKHMEQ